MTIEKVPKMKLAVAAAQLPIYSETFIKMQMEHLPCSLRIFGTPAASQTDPGGKISKVDCLLGIADKMFLRGVDEAKRKKGEKEKLKALVGGAQRAVLKKRFVQHGISAVLANFGHYSLQILPVCRDLAIPLVVHFHGLDAHEKRIVKENAAGYRELGKHAAAIIVVSHFMKEALAELGLPPEKLHVIRYGVDPVRFPEKVGFEPHPVFFGIGRFVDKKAPYLTLLAFKKVFEECPEAQLILAGDGPLFETTRNLAGALGITRGVKFPGVLAHEEVAKCMQSARAFVQHSIQPEFGDHSGDCEGTPVAILEAMMSGLAVVSTRHAGIAEVIEHGRTGLLVEERDVDGMAAAMLEIARSPELAKTLGAAARVDALQRYTSSQYISTLLGILSGCVPA